MKRLIKKAQNNDEKAFIKLFEKYEADLYKVAFMYVGNQDEALDVIQETAYRSFKSITRLREAKYLKTWLTKITINCSMDLLRDQKKNKVIDIDKIVMTDEDTMDLAENIDLKITLNDLIHQLDPKEKSVIILRFYNDFTLKQTSEILEIPLGTVKTTLYRALEKLRKNIEEAKK